MLMFLGAVGSGESIAGRQYPSYAIISKAHRNALDDYRKKRDAAAAVRILEEKGVRELMTSKPKGMPGDQYIALINDYGYFLSRTDDRYQEAIDIIGNVLRLDPDREAAYLNLGDVHLRISKEARKPEDATDADAAYRKYFEIVRRKGKNILLPERVVDAVYDSKSRTVCQFMAYLITSDRMDEWERFFDPETPIGGYDHYNDPDIFKRLPISKAGLSEYFLHANRDVSLLKTDVDGNEDIRFHGVDGSMRCESNFFFRRNKRGTFEPLEDVNREDELSGGGASLCIGRRLRFFRYRGMNHIVHEDHEPFGGRTTRTVYSTRSGILRRECSLEESFDAPRVTTKCGEPICNIVRDMAKDLLRAAASEELLHGVEKELQDYGPLEPNKEKRDWGETFYFFPQKSPHRRTSLLALPLYSVDMDNDGNEEIFSKRRSTGAGLLLVYDILKRADGQFHVVHAETEWGRTVPSGAINPLDESYAHFYPNEDFVFERADGKNYLVTVKMIEDMSRRGHRLNIYLLGKGKTSEIGILNAVYERSLALPD